MSMTYKKFRVRYTFVVVTSIVVWAALVLKMFYIQVIDPDDLGEALQSQFEDKIAISPLRGNFYDRNGKKLTDNIEHFTFAAHPAKVQDKDAVARLFSKTFNKSQRHYLNKLKTKKPFVYLEKDVNPLLGRELSQSPLPAGVQVQSKVRRYYPYGDVAAPLIGFVGTENHGLSGLEDHYDHQLAGIDGWRELGSDGRGNTRIRGGFREQKPINGDDCFLTIDVDIQIIIEEELRAAVERHQADKAEAILVDPNTGEVLALANIPTFNPNSRSKITEESLIAHPIMSAFEPGSTFKVVGATALLESKKVHPMDVFDCENGKFSIHGIDVKDWKSFQNLTFAEVLQNSSNIGIIKAVEALDESRMFNTARKFGFSEKSGIQFPYESSGSLKNNKLWSQLSKSEIAIGYEVSVTTLQLAMAYSAIGNGGVLMKPQLIQKLKTPKGYEQKIDQIDALRRVASEKTMHTMSDILEKAVSQGTGHKAFLPNLKIAGKTGTAKKIKNGKYVSEYVASFASYYPSDDPDYTLIISVDHPRRGGYTGGMVAAPIAKEIYRRIYNLTGHDDEPYLQSTVARDKDKGALEPPRTLQGQLLSASLPVLKANNAQVTMPDLKGMSLKMSLSGLYAMGLKPIPHGSGRVIRQIPAAGKTLKTGQSVEIYLGE
ncbi:MAG: transpeptidase family protein [Candidatus Marinimicrobia bacterium]|jgi:cell division protein FtsI (penicillin-binding protein 3)|nr:transpeptidase family protein [Candidatus Neomarinimicrobiota bacterium]MBT3825359.1 transpeptidase family protein [Candidatus Neomarinimicrobiota bacterium]MBT4296521.1 transpeptidase family protein [Candidatus Neomarinimicrobiota bacterium]MBT4420697.1 transpeptidase family protein [Candidatus Neomarinimicrobiota bacterium]MBT4993471.1 transpeptidase family protein [Candidatus Neomarinimicrobiota bacterium]